MSIKNKIGIVFIFIILFLTVITNVGWQQRMTSVLEERIIKDQTRIAEDYTANLENFFLKMEQAMLNLISDRIMAGIINEVEEDPLQIINNIKMLDSQFSNIMNIALDSALVDSSAVLFIEGYSIVEELEIKTFEDGFGASNLVLNSKEVKEQLWYREANQRYNFFYFEHTLDKESIFMARNLRNPFTNYSDMGVAVIKLRKDYFSQFLGDVSEETDDIRTIYDVDDNIIYSTNDVGLILEEDYLVNTTQLKNGWKLKVLTPRTLISEEIWRVQRYMILLSAIIILIGIGVIYFVAYIMTKPIINLANHVKEIHGDEDKLTLIDVKSKDEIGVLNLEFNEMLKRIKRLITRLYDSNERERKAELKALQAQINPHFIYNTLDTVNWIALYEGQTQIADISTSLAEILRYNLKAPDKMVKLSDELKHINNYLRIQKIRYEERLNIQFLIEDRLLDYKVPKCIMQPIVENVFHHAVVNDQQVLGIKIYGHIEGDYLILEIIDDGKGADCDAINAYLNDGKSVLESDTIGIKNVHSRMRLLYDEHCGLTFRPNSENGVTVMMTLKI